MEIKENMTPSYIEILEEIGKQLNSRKRILLKRIFLIFWPFMILSAFLYTGLEFGFVNENSMFSVDIAAPIIGLVVFGFIWMLIFSVIFETEKNIWIDAHFDNRSLTSDDSWRIARKLLWPSVLLRVKTLFRYYLPPIFAFIFLMIGMLYLTAKFSNADTILVINFAAVIILTLAFIAYLYYINIRLRYLWFVFLDRYGEVDFSHSEIYGELGKLNEMSRSDSFKKALVSSLGVDTVGLAVRKSVDSIAKGATIFGSAGKIFGGMFSIVGNLYAAQSASYGKISAMYILYRFARKELYGDNQQVNENVYGL